MRYAQPVLAVDRFRDCVHFYRDLLGVQQVQGDDSGPMAVFESDGARFTLVDMRAIPAEANGVMNAEGGRGSRVTLVFRSQDIDAEFERLTAAGVTYEVPPHEFEEWGVRSSVCLDPDGNPVEIVLAPTT
jgi:catechol 2,3-dioxygenase-like lactoylglutathione lyase family enzyme